MANNILLLSASMLRYRHFRLSLCPALPLCSAKPAMLTPLTSSCLSWPHRSSMLLSWPRRWLCTPPSSASTCSRDSSGEQVRQALGGNGVEKDLPIKRRHLCPLF